MLPDPLLKFLRKESFSFAALDQPYWLSAEDCFPERSHDEPGGLLVNPPLHGYRSLQPNEDPGRSLARGQTLFLVSKTARKSRVGKGRPASSSELRVSPSPSKIPYGGFSPVRLQMDRQWRPSTRSQGLSAVHMRPMTPSYTPPQFSLPGIRDPRRDYPF